MKRQFITILLISIGIIPALSQQTEHKNTVSYDPSFWAHELKLDIDQRNRINAINADFYEHLRNRPSLTQFKEYLITRQELILETLHARQKRKWEKITGSL